MLSTLLDNIPFYDLAINEMFIAGIIAGFAILFSSIIILNWGEYYKKQDTFAPKKILKIVSVVVLTLLMAFTPSPALASLIIEGWIGNIIALLLFAAIFISVITLEFDKIKEKEKEEEREKGYEDALKQVQEKAENGEEIVQKIKKSND